jgi:hypothetical protein
MSRHVPDRDIENILRIDVDLAKQELDALVAFWRVSAAPPNGGGAKNMENAIARENLARESLTIAIHRLNEFIRDGKLPEKL